MKKILIILALLMAVFRGNAQIALKVDTLQCHIIGFNVGLMAPSSLLSRAITSAGETSTMGTMHDLYKAPFLDFGATYAYKTLSNWMYTFDANFFFGSENLRNAKDRMDIYADEGVIIPTGYVNYDADVKCYNRGFSFQVGVGKIFALTPKNPNSGIVAKLSGGYIQNQTIFQSYNSTVPQIEGDYAHLYDHQRRGAILTESIGYLFMSNHINLANFSVSFEMSECLTFPTRDYIIDNLIGLRGRDNNHYFDVIWSIKLCWMFPLTGKPTYDYFYN